VFYANKFAFQRPIIDTELLCPLQHYLINLHQKHDFLYSEMPTSTGMDVKRIKISAYLTNRTRKYE